MKKTMYTLVYCFEGVDDNYPYASAIAVSEDKEKLREKMMECVEEDCTEPTDEDDAWDTDCNFQIVSNYGGEVTLQHRKNVNLYAKYRIQHTEMI